MPRTFPTVLLALVLLGVEGCGGGQPARVATARTTALPALASLPPRPGEIVVRADGSPGSFGPYTFKGRYLVRFAQYAPENARLDFSAQTPLTVALEHQAGVAQGATALFQQAGRTGTRVLAIQGSYIVDVSFGDYPFVIRFTPHP